MHSQYHRCPQCRTVGKVNRSKPRNLAERLRMRLVPVYSVYRCHNCNWRGWLRRSNATNVKVALVVAFYAIVGVAVIAGTVVAIQRLWPSPEYEYSE